MSQIIPRSLEFQVPHPKRYDQLGVQAASIVNGGIQAILEEFGVLDDWLHDSPNGDAHD